MPGISVSIAASLTALTLAVAMNSSPAEAQTERVVHSFNGSIVDASQPQDSVVFDSSGNLYGTSLWGGAHGLGTAFQFSPRAGGGWSEKILHPFQVNGTDGGNLYASLVLDAHGNAYGMASNGGSSYAGMAFELTPRPGGVWVERVLYSFQPNGIDGYFPTGGLTLDSAGNLYGTTEGGGPSNTGTVFELSSAGGVWSEKMLYTFHGSDGTNPPGGVIRDSSGNLYGTTYIGGSGDGGVVYKLSPTNFGPWTETVLHNFSFNGDGYGPLGLLVFDSAGNLYGTTAGGGAFGNGRVFELSPASDGTWTETVIHDFGGTDGASPVSLIFDAFGNLYGNTTSGGLYNYGTVYKLTPSSGGAWTETVLHNFNQDGTDGIGPSGVVFDAAGNLWGTTEGGGAHSAGTLFVIRP